MSDLRWEDGRGASMLAEGEVHVWRVPLDPGGDLSRLFATLDAAERARAGRYVFDAPREQFVRTRGMLRVMLGRYLGIDPAAVAFGTTATGKPVLPEYPAVSFNVSHTQGMALLAFALRVPVGVDVERLRPYPTHRDMARRYFSPAEAEAIEALGDGSESAFFAVWTRKEAFLKATGLGLAHGLERFTVSAPGDGACRLTHIDGDAREAARWTMAEVRPGAEHVGTLAAEATGVRVRLWAAGSG